MKNFGQSRYEDPEFLRAMNAVNNPFLLDSYFESKDNDRELVSINFLIYGFTRREGFQNRLFKSIRIHVLRSILRF